MIPRWWKAHDYFGPCSRESMANASGKPILDSGWVSLFAWLGITGLTLCTYFTFREVANCHFFIGKSWYIIMLIRVSHRSSYHSYGSEKYHINHFVSSSMGGQIAKRIQPFSRCLQRLNLVAWRGAMARRHLRWEDFGNGRQHDQSQDARPVDLKRWIDWFVHILMLSSWFIMLIYIYIIYLI